MQGPPATEIEIGAGHVGGIFRLVISQAEEGFAHLRSGIIPERGMPGCDVPQPVHSVVGRPVERNDIEICLYQVDEGQEEGAVQTVLVKIAGRPVAGGDDRNTLIADKSREEARHDRGIGRIVDDHFVECEAAYILRDIASDLASRIARIGFTALANAAIDLQHEFMEMHASLFIDTQSFDEEIHEHGFAATDAAPHVDALRVSLSGAEQLRKQTA